MRINIVKKFVRTFFNEMYWLKIKNYFTLVSKLRVLLFEHGESIILFDLDVLKKMGKFPFFSKYISNIKFAYAKLDIE